MSLAYVRLPKGSIITCCNPWCDERIGRLTRDLRIADPIKSNMIDGSGQGTRIDKEPRCKVCNHKWFVLEKDLARIHTVRGWWPTKPMIMEALSGPDAAEI